MSSGRLYVTGIGPGDAGYMTSDAEIALEESDLIVGYSVYINLLGEKYSDKEIYSTGMGGEAERCRYALSRAAAGDTVSVVCSGDPGVYGMASLIYELAGDGSRIDITIIPGVTAALSGAALLGAPIGNDFAVISLSTALTSWEVIGRRLRAAAEGDFCIVLYNPMSRHRPDTLRKACDVMMGYAGADRIAGYVRNIGREDREYGTTVLGELRDMRLDMFTTVFIGNSTTRMINGKMITGREYGI